MSLLAESSVASSKLASSSSTPPTTVADGASDGSGSGHEAITVAAVPADQPRRPRRSRASPASPPASSLAPRRRTISGDTLVASIEAPPATALAAAAVDALPPPWSPARLATPRTRRQARESQSGPALLARIGHRGRRAVDSGLATMSRELRRLRDTNEFAGIDDRPVVHSVWSNGKYVDPDEPAAPVPKRTKVNPPSPEAEPITATGRRRVKKYLQMGLYAGQDAPAHPDKGLTVAEKKKLALLPELVLPSARASSVMPLPIYTGLRMLIAGRDFKLPYAVCNPLPPGQPKPDEWKKMTKNRFIGDSKDYWRKMPHLHDYQSKCVCKPQDGCGESCQNRIMLYECDTTNCNIGKDLCTNRAFAQLTARRAKGGKYRVGVEVIKTPDRGYGVRSNRCFEPNQIIMEYAGEIITEDECERRMNEVYKDNECYYLMSFDQNMIIDATTGSIARFVNHSCNPNCRMIKWIVSGQPRMALFAGDKPIMTGDELTYDYNFDPFSAKNVQACLCGEPNCRGVLGPKPREVKPPKTDLKAAVKATVKAGKRKLKELMGDDDADGGKAKKRKLQPAAGVKRSLSKAGIEAAKGAATALKRSMSTMTVNAKKAVLGTKAPAPASARTSARTSLLLRKASSSPSVKKTKASKVAKAARAKPALSRSSSLTIVAMGDENGEPGKDTPVNKAASHGAPAGSTASPRKSPLARIRVVSK